MGEWINICKVDDIKDNSIKKITLNEIEILIARTGSKFYDHLFIIFYHSKSSSFSS